MVTWWEVGSPRCTPNSPLQDGAARHGDHDGGGGAEHGGQARQHAKPPHAPTQWPSLGAQLVTCSLRGAVTSDPMRDFAPFLVSYDIGPNDDGRSRLFGAFFGQCVIP